jgi:hypothetical protein
MAKKFDIRKIRRLGAAERYGELYFYWREAEHMIASTLPATRRYGRRLKRRVESLFGEWFGGASAAVSVYMGSIHPAPGF